MHAKTSLLVLTAVFEAGAGIFLAVCPALALEWLLGRSQAGPPLIARIAGAILLAYGIACWLARRGRSQSAMLLVVLAYDVAAAALLVLSALVLNMQGIALWPAVGIHSALAAWSLLCIRRS